MEMAGKTKTRKDPPVEETRAGLPHDDEAEAAVIGSVILQPGALEKVFGQLESFDFYDQNNRAIFRAITALSVRNETIDHITINGWLTRETASGPDLVIHLAGLLSGLPNSLNIEAYAKTVKNLSVKRRLVMASQNLQTAILNSNGYDSALAELQQVMQTDTGSVGDPWNKRTFSLVDAEVAAKSPRAESVVDGLIRERSLYCVFSPPGAYKSMLIADMAVCVSAGAPYLGALPGRFGTGRGTKQRAVLWLDFDNGQDVTHARFDALRRAHGVPTDAPFHYVVMPSPWLDASDPAAMLALTARAKRYGAGLIVTDNLAVTIGENNENDSIMARVMSHWRRLTEETGAAVVLIHHPNKGPTSQREGNRIRGHSSIEASFDLALLVEREPDCPVVTVKSAKTRGAGVEPFSAYFLYSHRPGTDTLYEARFCGYETDDPRSDSTLEKTILETVKEHPETNKSTLAEMVRNRLENSVSQKRVFAKLESLVLASQVVEISGAHGAKLYVLRSSI
jgi:hypothetical protein